MTWIKTVADDEARGRLRILYDRIRAPDGQIDNIMSAHSLRPHTMEGHMAIYKYVLHHSRNTLSKSYLEIIGVYVSLLNECRYCIDHHYAGLLRLLNDGQRGAEIRAALDEKNPAAAFDGEELAGLLYVEKLTTNPTSLTSADIESMREAGFDDGAILEINQDAAYFAYANRTVLGLGINTEGDIIGLSPGDSTDPDNWSHA